MENLNRKFQEMPEGQRPQGERIVKEAIREFESGAIRKKSEKLQDISEKGGASMKGANQAKRKSVLGRGLNALMSGISVPIDPNISDKSQIQKSSTIHFSDSNPSYSLLSDDESKNASEPVEGSLAYLPLERVVANPHQPRKHFSKNELDALARSIKETGLLQPIVVRRVNAESGIGTTPGARYEIIAGERRFRASQIAGLKTIPAQVKKVDDTEALELGIIENIQREDLNPIEEAQAFQRLIDVHARTQEEVARLSGRDRSSVANCLRLLKLPIEIQEMLIHKQLTAGHARAILALDNVEEQIALARKILESGLTVRAAEAESKIATKNIPGHKKSAPVETTPQIRALEERFRRALGTKVSLTLAEHGKGELKIKFFSKAELENLIEKLGA